MRTSHFDIAHYHEPLLPTLPMLVMRLHGGANVGTFHASGDRSPAYRCARPVLMPFFRRLHMCVAVSEPARDFADRYFPGDYRIVPNGVDTTRFRPDVVPDAQLRSQAASTLLYVGRLDRRKGVLNLLEAFARLRQMRDDVRLLVIGDGPMRSRCEGFVAHNHVPGVTFAGFVEAERLPGCYAAGYVFCASKHRPGKLWDRPPRSNGQWHPGCRIEYPRLLAHRPSNEMGSWSRLGTSPPGHERCGFSSMIP
jgi:phosphatidyl-myo-inositol alpha-mannosyltransferase